MSELLRIARFTVGLMILPITLPIVLIRAIPRAVRLWWQLRSLGRAMDIAAARAYLIALPDLEWQAVRHYLRTSGIPDVELVIQEVENGRMLRRLARDAA